MSSDWVCQMPGAKTGLGPVNQTEIELFRLLKSAKRERLALDLGCGYGRLGLRVAESGSKVLGIDSNQACVDRFNNLASNKNLLAHAIHCGIEDFSFEVDQYDVITAVSVFHFFTRDSVKSLLNEIKSATKSGGFNLLTFFLRESEQDKKSSGFLPSPEYVSGIYNASEWKIYDDRQCFVPTHAIGTKRLTQSLLVQKLDS